MRFFLPFYLVSLLLPVSELAAQSVKTSHAIAEIVAEYSKAKPGASPWVGLRLELDKDWHTYWKNPGDSGLPTKVQWELPPGWKISEPKWEVPARIPLPPLTNFGYSDETLLGYELQIPADEKEGTYKLFGKASWLVCKEECIPERADLFVNLQVSGSNEKNGTAFRMFEKLKAEQPIPLPENSFRSIQLKGKELALEFNKNPTWLNGKIDFFPYENEIVSLKDSPKVSGSNIVILSMSVAEPFSNRAKKLSGILLARDKVYELSTDLPTSLVGTGAEKTSETPQKSEISTEQSESPSGLLAILFGFFGGLLLNLMPCVFPVLGIKVMGFVHQNSGSKEKTRMHGYLYTLGVLFSFWVLGGVLLILRSVGENVGWGFQLQEPIFVLFLIYLFSVLTANLAGFFEIGGKWMGLGSHLSEKEDNWGAFFTGVLAVVVATPCSAPFMGVAIGAVLSKPAWLVMLVFSSLAIGLALPFLLLSWKPELVKALPKPGMWMVRLKEFFAFPMAATVIWLLWVFGQQVGIHGLGLAAIGVLTLFGSFWIFHRFPSGVKWVGWVLLLVSVGIGWRSAHAFRVNAELIQRNSTWQKFTVEAVEKDVASGKSVFVDFTAAWCLSCQANKALVLDTEEMREFFVKNNVSLYVADWTNNDPIITKELEKYGRIGVPLYLAYSAGSQAPKILPQILTKEEIRNAFLKND